MQTTQIGKHKVEIFDAIDEMPVVRFHKYQKLLLIDAGIGSDIASYDRGMEKARQFLAEGKTDKAAQELENARLCIHFIQQGINPKHRAFAALVKSIDGVACDDMSDDALEKVTKTLQDAPNNLLTALLEAVKKKIDSELMVYFPAIFNDSSVKEYYDLLKRRANEILKGIAAGVDEPDKTVVVEKLTAELITYSKPQSFTGPDGVEVQFDRQFEDLCLALSEQLHVEPKKYTVLEFYNAFDFIRERAKKAKKGGKN